MKLYTIQHTAAWENAKKQGFLTGDKHHVDQYFLPAYRWMQVQMSMRLSKYSGDLPIWAWLKRPDLRHRWGHRGESLVMLTLEVPQERILISDYEGWHFVLNKWYLGRGDTDFDRHNLVSEEVLAASWERIFGPFPIWSDSPDTEVQACVDHVYLYEVKGVRHFTSR